MTSSSIQLTPFDFVSKCVARGAAVMAIVSVAACSTAPDWAKPGLIYGDDAAEASEAAASEADFPELSSVPEKPEPPALARELAEQRAGLAADRAQARYTDEVLRGGQEAPAPAPMPAPQPAPSAAVEIVEPAIETAALPVAPAPEPAAPVAPAPVAQAAPEPVRETIAEVAAPVAPATRPAVRRPAVPPLADAAPVSAPRAPERTVSTAVAPAAAPVAPAAPAPVAAVMPAATSGGYSRQVFEASSAPALAPEALEAAGPTVGSRIGVTQTVVIGDADPEDPVQVNMDALMGIPGPGASLQAPAATSSASEFANQGGPGNIPPYIVRFGYGSSSLNSEDRELVRQAADMALSHGSRVRVVGHASSKTGDLDLSSHLMANFSVSMDRATAVANELIQAGVDPSLVMVEAKSDSVPVYYESMPAGEAGNRRAEIFIE